MLGKKILIVSLSAPTNVGLNGGAQVYILNMSIELVKLGYNITIVGLFEKRNGIKYPLNEIIEGVKIKRLGKSKLGLFSLLKWVRNNNQQYNIVIENMMQYPLLLPLVLSKGTNLYILKHHFLGKDSIKILGYIKGIINLFNEHVLIPLYNYPFIFPSEFTASYFKRNNFFGKEKTILINPPGIEFSKEFEINRYENPTILYLGTLNINRKKVDHLIEAFKSIEKEIIDAELIVCGEGPSKEYLMELAGDSNVNFVGYISKEEKIDYLSKSWVFASPSLVEGFGITWIEAGFFKLPVVVYDIGIKTVNQKCACLVEKDNINDLKTELKKLLIDNEKRLNMGEFGYKNAINYTWEANGQKIKKFLNK